MLSAARSPAIAVYDDVFVIQPRRNRPRVAASRPARSCTAPAQPGLRRPSSWPSTFFMKFSDTSDKIRPISSPGCTGISDRSARVRAAHHSAQPDLTPPDPCPFQPRCVRPDTPWRMDTGTGSLQPKSCPPPRPPPPARSLAGFTPERDRARNGVCQRPSRPPASERAARQSWHTRCAPGARGKPASDRTAAAQRTERRNSARPDLAIRPAAPGPYWKSGFLSRSFESNSSVP